MVTIQALRHKDTKEIKKYINFKLLSERKECIARKK